MITDQEFEQAIQEADTITKWRDLEVGRVYKIIGFDILDTKVGPSMKLSLLDSDEIIHTVWAPDRVKATLQNRPCTNIRSNGLKATKSGDNKYWDFNAVRIL